MAAAEFQLNSFEASKFALTSLAIVVLIISLLTAIDRRSNKYASRSNQPAVGGGTFLGSILVVAILYQYRLIAMVSMQFPGDVHRLECLYSNKGGKRPMGATSEEFRNPCFALQLNSSDTNSSNFEDNSPNTVEESGAAAAAAAASIWRSRSYHSTSLCPYSKTSSVNNEALPIDPFISTARDCHSAQRGLCSLSEPCTPCEISRFDEFHNSQHGWQRCQTCAFANKYGECNFVEGVGPYCLKNAVSWDVVPDVVPCRRCCTDGAAVFDDDGICH